MSRVRVVVVDDHALFRAGVVAEIGTHAEVVGQAGDVDEAIRVIREASPEVVLLDVHLPSGSGRLVIERLAGEAQGVNFLALSVSDASEDVIDLVRAGARGYVTKSISADDLVSAIDRVAQGDAVFSPRLAGFVLDAFAATTPAASEDDADLDQLTHREREVMRFLARGYAYKEIGLELGISIKTVESHASAVLRKLQLSSRGALTRWAAARRLI
jgi:DNA-binding NarL/FixJ family response regulator